MSFMPSATPGSAREAGDRQTLAVVGEFALPARPWKREDPVHLLG